ncbi:unnamed protein product [Didymodactylos carnosus]|uniref:Protein kinase domain-containing protein n=1 Tax=Didymodactylos carnosus TaxID=1234261 RepID=A0A815CBR7_9BILA|nr:unnamed protein product [Didymodactylos carnosus]CAF1281461.1 unnamed protein product [Didymodactylos carnosus]CAF3850235.1 unnamed protein product [Didymodactylos carnosus]CAF4077200.1 unnamed protein product [Didymodactylos carnosus]
MASDDLSFDKFGCLSSELPNGVLLLNGCFNPIHNNHIRTLELARQHLSAEQKINIIGSLICLTHEAALRRKMMEHEHILSAKDRIAMCQLAVSEYNWLTVFTWQTQHEKNPGIIKTKKYLETVLDQHFNQKVQIISICGGDALPKLKGAYTKELVVTVINRSVGFDFDAWLSSHEVSPYRQNIHVVYDHDCPTHISSTFIRNQISSGRDPGDTIHPFVLKYHREHNITYTRSNNEEKLIDGSSLDQYSSNTILSWSDLQGADDIELGRGRCANVYAKQLCNVPVAVKVIKLTNRNLKQFRQELDVIHHLGIHSNILHFYGHGVNGQGNIGFYVMEQCLGGNLLEHLKQYSYASSQTIQSIFPNQQWIHLCIDIARGLAYIESIGVLHRDIKTDNVLLVLNPTVAKIADFTVSKHTSTTEYIARGSIRHYAPEAIEQKHIYTPQADVYMFAMLLFELAHGGRRIWQELETRVIVAQVLKGERPLFQVQCHTDYVQIVRECWDQLPLNRPKFDQIVEKLEGLETLIKSSEMDDR